MASLVIGALAEVASAHESRLEIDVEQAPAPPDLEPYLEQKSQFQRGRTLMDSEERTYKVILKLLHREASHLSTGANRSH